jgi:hypothetical protein
MGETAITLEQAQEADQPVESEPTDRLRLTFTFAIRR